MSSAWRRMDDVYFLIHPIQASSSLTWLAGSPMVKYCNWTCLHTAMNSSSRRRMSSWAMVKGWWRMLLMNPMSNMIWTARNKTSQGRRKTRLPVDNPNRARLEISHFSSLYPHLYCTDLLQNSEDVKNPSMTGIAAVLTCWKYPSFASEADSQVRFVTALSNMKISKHRKILKITFVCLFAPTMSWGSIMLISQVKL